MGLTGDVEFTGAHHAAAPTVPQDTGGPGAVFGPQHGRAHHTGLVEKSSFGAADSCGDKKAAQSPTGTIPSSGLSQSLNLPALLPVSKDPSILSNHTQCLEAPHTFTLSFPGALVKLGLTPDSPRGLSSPCTSFPTLLLTLQQHLLSSGGDLGGQPCWIFSTRPEVRQTSTFRGDVRGSGGLDGMWWVSTRGILPKPRTQSPGFMTQLLTDIHRPDAFTQPGIVITVLSTLQTITY